MKQHWPKVVFIVVVIALVALGKFLLGDYLTVDNLREHKERLFSFIARHYVEAALSFIVLYIGTALFIPGALALTVAGGMVFGVIPTVLYANVGATTGAVLAFLISRSVIGSWIQERFETELARFNDEMSRHGRSYLLTLRLLPIAPFFVINYCAGITRIPLKTFLWTTSAGMIPGSAIYAYLGHQLRSVNRPSDLLSWKIMALLVLLALFALAPVITQRIRKINP